MKKHNFNAGPSILPREVIEDTAKAILDFNGSGLSLMEISHRAKDFQPIVDEAVALFKELLNIPEGYSVLFLGGGASLEFCMIPFNFLEKKAAYLNTGVWAKKAMKEAKGFGEVVEVASSAEATYTYIPKDYTVPADADYFHITTNNTIYGTELKEDLNVNVPMVADMSSDIFSRPIDVSKYICIYGGAQKNLAPAGVTFVIVKNDAVGKVSRYAELSDSHRWRFNVQYSSGCSYLCGIADIALDKGSGRCEGNGTSRHRKGRYAVCRDRPQQDVCGYCRQRRPFTHEYLLRDGSRIQGTGSRLPEIRYRKGYGRYQGTPFRRRFPCILLQCHAEGKRTGFDRLHAGI